jgi:hypothetical protein
MVQNVTYKITETLSDVQSLSILGRATRVFAVTDPNGEERVIKDVWVDDSRRREHDIQKAVIEDLTKTWGGILANRFFTHLGYEDVPISDKSVDSTMTFSQNAENEDLNFTNFHKRFALRRPIRFARSDIPLPRVHHRLIIKERGTPLLEVLQISTCASILRQLVDRRSFFYNTYWYSSGVLVIYMLAKVSWVHRDLSVCNIYSVNGKLKLGDLEYAKKFGQESESGSHDLRTVCRVYPSATGQTHRQIGYSMVLV